MKEVCLREHPVHPGFFESTSFLYRIVDPVTLAPLYCPLNPDAPCGEACALFNVEMEPGQGGQPSKMFVACRGTRFGRLRLPTGEEIVRR
jgi:hypothetical protein